MSKKKKKKKQQVIERNPVRTAEKNKLSPRQKREWEEARKKKAKRALIITAIVLAAAIVIGAVALLIVNIVENRKINYLKDDLSVYLTVPASAYRGLVYTSELEPVSDSDVDLEILRLLATNKGAVENGGAFKRYLTMTPGDRVELY